MARALFILLVACFIPCATTFAQDHSAKTNGTIEVLSQFGGVIMGVSIYEGKAYVGEGRELVVYDISGSAPVEIGRTEPMPNPITAIGTGNGLASVASANELRLYYISNMTVPFYLGSLSFDSAISDIDVNGWMAYLGTSTGFLVVDNSSYRPELKGSYDSTDQIIDIAVDGTTVYYSHFPYPYSMEAIDCSVPEEPTHIATYQSAGFGAVYLDAQDGYVYFTDRDTGLNVATLSAQNTFTILSTLTGFQSSTSCTVDGNRLYLATGYPDRIQSFDISSPTSPSLMNSYRLPATISNTAASNGKLISTLGGGFGFLDTTSPGTPTLLDTLNCNEAVIKIAINNDYAYVLTDNGFQIYDASDLSNMSYVTGQAVTNCTDISVAESTAIISTENGFSIYNIANPSTPVHVVDVPAGHINKIVAERGYLFAVSSLFLYSYDIHNPSLPVLTDSFMTYSIDNMVLNNNLLYLSKSTNETVYTLDVSDPENLDLVEDDLFSSDIKHMCRDDEFLYVTGTRVMRSTQIIPGRQISWSTGYYFNDTIMDIIASNGRVIVATGAPEVLLVDMASPGNPVIIDTIPCTQTPSHIYLKEDILFITEGDSIRIFDLNLLAVNSYLTSVGRICSQSLQGNTLITSAESNITAVDVTDPSHPQISSSLFCDLSYAQHLSCTSTHAYISDTFAGIQIVDITNPDAINRAGGYSGQQNPSGIFAGNEYAYTLWPSGQPQLVVLDLTHPDWPKQVGGTLTVGIQPLSLVGNTLWLTDATGNTVMQYDITNPTVPGFAGQFTAFARVRAMGISGDYLYLAAGQTGLLVYNISNPAAPSLITIYTSQSFTCYDLAVNENLLYAMGNTGFTVLDISNPESPLRIGRHFPAHSSSLPVIHNNLAYLSGSFYGVTILQLPDQYLDEDGDGVLNTEDQCPGSLIPEESADEYGCLAGVNGDSDQDGDVDLEDYAAFQRCYGEYQEAYDTVCLPTFDKAGDRIIDEEDFELFESLFTGPQQ